MCDLFDIFIPLRSLDLSDVPENSDLKTVLQVFSILFATFKHFVLLVLKLEMILTKMTRSYKPMMTATAASH